MNNKATHYGTCQVCGSQQKLPNGKLAKHGYTTRYGFFEGVCIGSGNLPLEVSCDMIETSVKHAKASMERFEALCNAWRNEDTKFMGGRATKYGMVWFEVTDVKVENNTATYTSQDAYGKPWNRQEFCTRTAPEICKIKNQKYASHCMVLAGKAGEYVEAQQQVLKTWKPQPLIPVKG